LNQVDFSDPLSSDVKEPLVTGPSAPPVKSVDDLTGKEIHVRLSSSYYESLVQYTLKTRQCRKKWKNLGAWWHYLKKYAGQYDFDYLMVGAMADQESGLDQSTPSPAEAVGVMQLLASTAVDPDARY
jgi:membrane-bound lytic murein transglycosylase MltF